ncbi:MAG: tRNA (adenosine(37)-N6)-dimethylallyltransferase MiaA [Chthoniobacterales bacterium]|nr:tRNA (adenosine(37)-N6)-dimethylallyltransferase MiaA [Chthoniobacterales bacterium]
MKNAFFIVGPTAVGKSELAAEVARACGGEIVSADAFQVYCGLDLLTAKPEAAVLRAVPHHLIGCVPLDEEMNAERFRAAAVRAIGQIHSRGKPAFVVGGSGMYVKAITHGLSPLPPADPHLRQELEQQTAAELNARLAELDPVTAEAIDRNNKHRVLRAVEICLLTGRPASELRRLPVTDASAGVLVLRDRAELYQRIDERVAMMFRSGVIDEVRTAGPTSSTAVKTLGLSQIQELIAGRISEAECIAQIQQATRRYAKRQLTWFQRQTNFEPLNLSSEGWPKAIECITRKARLSFAP